MLTSRLTSTWNPFIRLKVVRAVCTLSIGWGLIGFIWMFRGIAGRGRGGSIWMFR